MDVLLLLMMPSQFFLVVVSLFQNLFLFSSTASCLCSDLAEMLQESKQKLGENVCLFEPELEKKDIFSWSNLLSVSVPLILYIIL